MEVNGVVVMALIYGGLAMVSSTVLRYRRGPKLPSSITGRMMNAFRVIDVHQDKPEVRLMLYQYTGVIWLLLGTIYGIILKRYDIHGVIEHIFEFLVLVVPGTLLILTMSMLRRIFWR